MGNPKGDGSESGGYEQQPLPPAAFSVPGLDVSHYQTGMDWKEAVAKGYKFCIAKAYDGKTGRDNLFVSHRANATTAGLTVGGYLFFRFDIDPILQAEKYMEFANPITGELPPCVDNEWDKYSEKYGDGKHMDQEASDSLLRCLERVERLSGMVPILYTSYYFFQGFTNPERFAKYPLWVPAYHTTLDKVKIPKPWTKPIIWQNRDDITIGHATKCDGNVFLGTIDELKALCKK